MQIRMLITAPGSVDGIRVASYVADQEYDLTATAGERDLAAAFVGSGLAEEVGAGPAPVVDAAPAGAEGITPATADAADAPAASPAKPGRKSKA